MGCILSIDETFHGGRMVCTLSTKTERLYFRSNSKLSKITKKRTNLK